MAVYTVAKELGHRSTQMIERVYGHLGKIRHRREAVEYRIENHPEQLGERLAAIQTSAA